MKNPMKHNISTYNLNILNSLQAYTYNNGNRLIHNLLHVYCEHLPLKGKKLQPKLYFTCRLNVNVFSSILSSYVLKNNMNNIKQFNLNLFNNNSKYNSLPRKIRKPSKINNYAGESKHHPPAVKEWFNSIYVYNNNTIRLLPSLYKMVFKLVKSYFYFYSVKLENNNIKSRRPRLISKRRSTDRIFTSKPELKHKSEEVTLNSFVYNRQNKNYIYKNKQISTVDNIDRMLPPIAQFRLADTKIPVQTDWPSNTKMNGVLNRTTRIKQKINKQVNVLFNTNNTVFFNNIINLKPRLAIGEISCPELFKKNIIYQIVGQETEEYKSKNVTDKNFIYTNLCKAYIERDLRKNKLFHLKHFVARCFRKEKLSIRFKQLKAFNDFKFKETYLRPLSEVLGKVLKNRVNFNFVNLKYIYLNSYIFTTSIATKVKNKKNRLLRILKKSLLMFELPPIDRLTVYNEMYNKQKKLQNIKIMYSQDHNNDKTESFSFNMDVSYLGANPVEDHVDNTVKSNMLNYFNKNDNLRTFEQLKYYYNTEHGNKSNHLLNAILLNMKNKYVSGIRLEAAGRLTRRNTAARSVSKLRYIGNIRNMDSSYKGLSCVILKGYEKSNLQFCNIVSKLRIGSYSIKG